MLRAVASCLPGRLRAKKSDARPQAAAGGGRWRARRRPRAQRVAQADAFFPRLSKAASRELLPNLCEAFRPFREPFYFMILWTSLSPLPAPPPGEANLQSPAVARVGTDQQYCKELGRGCSGVAFGHARCMVWPVRVPPRLPQHATSYVTMRPRRAPGAGERMPHLSPPR